MPVSFNDTKTRTRSSTTTDDTGDCTVCGTRADDYEEVTESGGGFVVVVGYELEPCGHEVDVEDLPDDLT